MKTKTDMVAIDLLGKKTKEIIRASMMRWRAEKENNNENTETVYELEEFLKIQKIYNELTDLLIKNKKDYENKN